MSDYKLVPVEPTAEMEQAGGAVYWKNIEDVREIYSAMLAAAPAVQRANLTDEQIFDISEPFGAFEFGDAQGAKSLAFARAILAAAQPAEQQPAPDIEGLVEALEKARDAIGSLPQDALGNVPDTQQLQGWHIRDELINDISTALAAWRGDDGEK